MTTLKSQPAVYNIPAGLSFADALAKGILGGILSRAGDDPLALSDTLVLLPSRRACRTLRDAFLRLSGGKALVLPRLQPIGDVDPEEVALLGAGEIDIPPAVSRLERQLLLARLILKTGRAQSFDQAAALALELGRFLDEAQTERLDFKNLENLVPEDFAGHWQQTLEFLKILTHHWPEILQERGVIDFADRRNRLLEAQMTLWQENPPAYPVIAAGSTGTVPASAELLCLAARLPQGMLVLPGLDMEMDADSWDKAGEDHPQFNLKKLLARAGIARDAVLPFPLPDMPDINPARVRLLREAMRPAETTDQWRALTPHDLPPQALEGLQRIDCRTPQEEADVIALLLRAALEEKGKTAALITPDRRLARRVSLSLQRWGIEIDDTAGQPLTELPVGMWLMLIADMAQSALAPVDLLAFLKHPMMAAGLAPEELRGLTQMLDRLVLRGPRPSPGFDGLRAAVEGLNSPPLSTGEGEDAQRRGRGIYTQSGTIPHPNPLPKGEGEKLRGVKERLLSFIEKLETDMAAFVALLSSGQTEDFSRMLAAHVALAEKLAEIPGQSGAARLWRNEAGEAARDFISGLRLSARDVPPLSPEEYVSLLRTLLKGVTVRPRHGTHPRLSILGQVEARLYCADMVILGGLNEGTWPDLPAHDPWMSRPMRKKFGLPSPEKSISLAAHDFVQAAAAPHVVLTRAEKIDGAPAVAARWLFRLEAALGAVGIEWGSFTTPYRSWLKDMDTPATISAIARPAPAPPVAARPRALSVTKIESWMRDPYQIYARYVLGLEALDPIDADPGGAERGVFIHAALEKFVREYPEALPSDAEGELRRFGRMALQELRIPEEVEAFWWPRFEKMVAHFIADEAAWRQKAQPALLEASGSWSFAAAGGNFTLKGKADRIDHLKSGGYAVIDYKSGGAPGKGEVLAGLSPQLPLEAVLLKHGAFEKLGAARAGDLRYWRVTGTGKKPAEFKSILGEDADVDAVTAAAETGLRTLVDAFDLPETPYLSHPRAKAKAAFSDYDHLARVREWGLSGDDESEEAA